MVSSTVGEVSPALVVVSSEAGAVVVSPAEVTSVDDSVTEVVVSSATVVSPGTVVPAAIFPPLPEPPLPPLAFAAFLAS